MAKGKTRRHKPMGRNEMLLRNPVWAADKHKPMPQSTEARLMVDARMALHRIMTGVARVDDPDELASAANVAMILCEWDEAGSREHLPLVIAGQNALVAAQLRANSGGAYTFTPEEEGNVRLMAELYEQLLQACDYARVVRALAAAADRIRAGQVTRAGWTTPPG
jgi:hypothetical protein